LKLRLIVDIDIPQIEGWSKEIAQTFVNLFKAIIEGSLCLSPWGATRYDISASSPEPLQSPQLAVGAVKAPEPVPAPPPSPGTLLTKSIAPRAHIGQLTPRKGGRR
jgi:hypothetical protein